MSTSRIFLLDLVTFSTRSLREALERKGHRVELTDSSERAVEALDAGEIAALLCNPELIGDSLLDHLRQQALPPPLFLFDDFGGVSAQAARWTHLEYDPLPRPAEELEIVGAVAQALERRDLQRENERLRRRSSDHFELGDLVSTDARMRRIFDTIEAIADSRASLLLQGESGTGKTVLARTVHERSADPDAPFVVVNCGALPTTLLESELFGHVRGSFTGAVRDRAGKFEQADGGTIFLDEIASAPPELQVKLLRVLEEGAFERVGDSQTRRVDVRLIAASNEELTEAVEEGRFRADLYYRINVVRIEVPPLRARPGDVPLLAHRFLERFGRRHGREVRGIETEALSALSSHPWPGNIRELENTIERAVLLTRTERLVVGDLWPEEVSGALGPRERPPEMDAEMDAETDAGAEASDRGPGAWDDLPLGPLKRTLEVPERWLILRALRHEGGNRQATARLLGINRTTLFNKMRKYDLLSLPAKMGAEEEENGPGLDQAG
jgi:two-component system, NtrC family, response regulator AtoC